MKQIIKLSAFLLLIGLLFQISCQKELSCENCKGNKPPIANAGADQIIVLPKDSAMLDGSVSIDPDGTIASYKWAKISGPMSPNIVNSDSSKTLVKNLVMGVYKFELTVKDNGGLYAKDTVQVIVNDPAVNQPPIANAGTDQTITLPTDSLLLNGSLSFDPDGTITSYKWAKISGPVSSNIVNTDSSKTLLKTLVTGVYQFELTVKDDGGLAAKDTVQIIVNDPAVNQLPIAKAGADQTITLPTDSVLLDGSASFDPDGTIVSYKWTKIAGAASTILKSDSAKTAVKTLTTGVYQFELRVTDNRGSSGKDTIQVTVNAAVSNNLPPVAKAGNDTIIQTTQTACNPIPVTFTLNGSNSYDPDGSIIGYLWTGPGNITSPNSAITTVNGTFQGTVEFILKVTDNNGLTSYDTIHISILPANRPLIPAQLTLVATLPQPRPASFAIAGNKIVFAGGSVSSQQGCVTTRVDIYDMLTNVWTTAQLSVARGGAGVTVFGNKIFFAGGIIPEVGPPYGCYRTFSPSEQSAAIDIYDASTNTWTNAQLSSARVPCGASAGNKVVFAGGDEYSSPPDKDIYDAGSNSWSTSSLSQGRRISQAAVAGNKIFFAGGSSPGWYYSVTGGISCYKQIDIYDALSNTWSVDNLSVERGEMGAISANNKIYWGGGFVWDPDPAINDWNITNSVEIKDLATNTASFDCLSEAKAGLTAARKDNKIVFFGGYFYGVSNSRFDIYDLTTHSWSIGVLPQNMVLSTIVSFNNTLYVTNYSKVWKLDF